MRVQERGISGASAEWEYGPEEQRQRVFEVYGNGEQLHSNKRVLGLEASAEEAERWVLESLAEAKLAGRFTVFVAGAFDVPHDNHEWYIRNGRTRAAERLLIQRGEEPSVENIQKTIAGDDIFFAVSIDADEALAKRKSGIAEKGGIERPVYPWQARAHRIAGYGFETVDGDYRPTVDLVLREGGSYEGTNLSRAYTIVEWLSRHDLIDAYIVYDEHAEDIATAQKLGFDPIIMNQDPAYVNDPRTGKAFSSSALIKRMQGKEA